MRRFVTGTIDRCHRHAQRVLAQMLVDSANRSPAMARHLAECPKCARMADRLGRVTAMLSMLSHSNPSGDLLGRANVHAMRMVCRTLRTSRKAAMLATATPRVPLAERLATVAWRFASPVATAMLIASVHIGMWHAMTKAEQAGQKLADYHLRNHVFPDDLYPDDADSDDPTTV